MFIASIASRLVTSGVIAIILYIALLFVKFKKPGVIKKVDRDSSEMNRTTFLLIVLGVFVLVAVFWLVALKAIFTA